MRNKKPPFEITNAMFDEITEIAELVGHITATQGLSANPTLRRTNRIRTIYSSLAIEQNTLSLEQVTAVLNGKKVIASPKDIAEVKNAYEIYDMLDSLNPYSVDDLLKAHAVMTKDLVGESGRVPKCRTLPSLSTTPTGLERKHPDSPTRSLVITAWALRRSSTEYGFRESSIS